MIYDCRGHDSLLSLEVATPPNLQAQLEVNHTWQIRQSLRKVETTPLCRDNSKSVWPVSVVNELREQALLSKARSKTGEIPKSTLNLWQAERNWKPLPVIRQCQLPKSPHKLTSEELTFPDLGARHWLTQRLQNQGMHRGAELSVFQPSVIPPYPWGGAGGGPQGTFLLCW